MPKRNGQTTGDGNSAVVELFATDAMAAVRHVAACLARRSHALLGLLCLPDADGEGRLLVALPDDGRIARLLVELGSLPGVREARRAAGDCLGCFGLAAAGLAA